MQSPISLLRDHIGQHLKTEYDTAYQAFTKEGVEVYKSFFESVGLGEFITGCLCYVPGEKKFNKMVFRFPMNTDNDRVQFNNRMINYILGALPSQYVVGYMCCHEAWMAFDRPDKIQGLLNNYKRVSQIPGRKEVVFHMCENLYETKKALFFDIVRANNTVKLDPMSDLAGATFGDGELMNLFAKSENCFQDFVRQHNKPPFPLPNLN